MIETPAMLEAFEVIGFTGAAILVTGWLIVSFSPPTQRRERVEWVAACGMYLALLSLFTHLSLKAYANGTHGAVVAFGFLVLFFTTGFVVCLNQTVTALRGRSTKGAESAVN
jgi:hypothetical protein